MEILGIGPMELVLILIIAMMVFGPDKLPEIGVKLGQAVKSMRRATHEFSREIDDARQAIEAPVREMTQPFQEIAQPVQQIRKDLAELAPLAQAVTNPQEALRQAVTPSLVKPNTTEQENNPAGDGLAGDDQVKADSGPIAGTMSEPGDATLSSTETADFAASALAGTAVTHAANGASGENAGARIVVRRRARRPRPSIAAPGHPGEPPSAAAADGADEPEGAPSFAAAADDGTAPTPAGTED